MAFGDTVRTTDASGAGPTDVSFSFTAPAAGNLIVVVVGRSSTHGAGGAWDVPSGWNKLNDSGINTGQLGGAAFWKIADGSETSFATTDTNPGGTWQVAYAEFEGPFTASPLDQAAENAANIGTVVTSQSTGTTGTTSQADELALAFFAGDRFDTLDGGGTRNYSNSFTEVKFASVTTSRPMAAIAKNILSATGTVECTYSVTDTGDEMYGVIATFKKLVATKAPVLPRKQTLYQWRKSA